MERKSEKSYTVLHPSKVFRSADIRLQPCSLPTHQRAHRSDIVPQFKGLPGVCKPGSAQWATPLRLHGNRFPKNPCGWEVTPLRRLNRRPQSHMCSVIFSHGEFCYDTGKPVGHRRITAAVASSSTFPRPPSRIFAASCPGGQSGVRSD